MSEIKINQQQDMTGEISVTDAHFRLDTSLLSAEKFKQIESTEGWERNTYQLGISEYEVRRWIESKSPILEIGPGYGSSVLELERLGINIYALEPSLKYSTITKSILHEEGKVLKDSKISARISSANAVDTSLAFPNIKFDAAFAIGINFQYYSESVSAFLNQAAGIIDSLKPGYEHYLTFKISNDGSFEFDFQHSNTQKRFFNITDFLEDHDILFSLINTRNASWNPIQALRIHNSEDASFKLTEAITTDTAKYTLLV